MPIIARCICFAILIGFWFVAPSTADTSTAAGVAAYESGDYETARDILRPRAEAGDPVAQVKYGLILVKGLVGPSNPKTAIEWFEKSAAQGNAEAEYCLGVAHEIGDAGEVDLIEAAKWYRKSAENGYPKAQLSLGSMLIEGKSIPANVDEGISWIRKAADQNLPSAEKAMAGVISNGVMQDKNLLGIRYWLQRATAHGNATAEPLLAEIAASLAEMEADGFPKTDGGDGLTMETAISFPDINKGGAGVYAEHSVTAAFFSGWKWKEQALLVGDDNRAYDQITLEKDGKIREIYFDVTEWFGKL